MTIKQMRCVYLEGRNYKARDFKIGQDPGADTPVGEPLRGLVAVIGPTGCGKSSITEALELLITGRYDQVAGRATPLSRNIDLLDLLGREAGTISLRGAFDSPLTTIDRRIGWKDNGTDTEHELGTSLAAAGSNGAKQKKIDARFGDNPAHFAVRELLRGSDRDRREAFLRYMASVPIDVTVEQMAAALGDLPASVSADSTDPIQWLGEIRESAAGTLRTKTKRDKDLQAERRSVATSIDSVGSLLSVADVESEIAGLRSSRDEVIRKIGEITSLRENRGAIERQLEDARSSLASAEHAGANLAKINSTVDSLKTAQEDASRMLKEAETATADHQAMIDSAQRSLEDAEREVKAAEKELKAAEKQLASAEAGVCPILGDHCETIGSDARVAECQDEIESRAAEVERLKARVGSLRRERDELATEASGIKQFEEVRRQAAEAAARAHKAQADALLAAQTTASQIDAHRASVTRLERQLAESSAIGSAEQLVTIKGQIDGQIAVAESKREEATKALRNRERLAEIDVECARLATESATLEAVVAKADEQRIGVVSRLVQPLSEAMTPLLAGAGTFEVQLVDQKGNVVFRPGLRGTDGLFRGLDQLSDGEVRIVWPAFCRGLSGFQERAGYRPVIINSLETVSEDLRDRLLARLVEEVGEGTLGQAWVSWNERRERMPKVLVDAEAAGVATIIDLWPAE